MCAMNPRLLVPRASGFNPRSIAGLELWLDAADTSTIDVDTGVIEWRDKSGRGTKFRQNSGNNQPATGTQTMNGRNVIAFDGSNDSLTSTTAPVTTYAMPVSMFFVQRIVAATNFGHTYHADPGSGFGLRQNSTTGRVQITQSVATTFTTWPTSSVGVDEIVTFICPPGATDNASYRSGAVQSITDTAQTKPVFPNNHQLGTRNGALFANVRIAEILIYKSLLTDAQRRSVESYLGKKWGIAVS